MKKYLLLFLLMFPIIAYSQSETTQLQYINMNLLGIHYNYEKPLSPKTTVTFHAGLAGELGYSNGSWIDEDDGWAYSVSGAIGADFRYYYNLAKRAGKGKNTKNNAASFWALDLQYITPAIYTKNFDDSWLILASPYWGFRSSFAKSWLFEFNTGINTGIQDGDWGWNIKFNLKLGYAF